MPSPAHRPADTGRSWRTAAYLVAVLLVTAGSVAALQGAPSGLARQLAVGVLGMLAIGTVLVRERHPWWFPAVALLAAVVGDGGLLLPAFVSLAVRRRDRWTMGATALAALALAVSPFWGLPRASDPGQLEVWPAETIAWFGQVLALGAALAFGGWIGTRRELVQSLRERADRAEREREAREREAALLERARIAQEMHDVLGHKLSLLTLQAGALEVNADAGADAVEEGAALLRQTAADALADLRSVVGTLREEDAPLVPVPGLADLGTLVERSRQAGARVAFDDQLGADATTVDSTVGRAVHRVLQEALTNAHRHAPGQPIHVRLSRRTDGLELMVENHVASGGSPSPGTGIGLAGLAERARLAGGTFEARQTGEVFRVRATFPATPSPSGRIDP